MLAPESDLMAVAVFCLEQARRALGIDWAEARSASTDFDAVERYTLHADHVAKSCRVLNKGWPSPFPERGGARRVAREFVERWRAAAELRNAYAHYEEALADPKHSRRGETNEYNVVCGIEVPHWDSLYVAPLTTGAPVGVHLLGKGYWFHGVHGALTELERQFARVLEDPETSVLRDGI